ncbi:MAG: hypothetical protein HN948_02875 [Clostridia bacterium]|mgnify:CR=1 FL=1|nr:hypothetical protein [Clostridia bacterium]MBT7121935.1 hypothetical protein [Clostridia bacterium]
MKKLLVILPIIILLLLAACTPDIVRNGGLVVRSSAEPESVESSLVESDADTGTISRGGALSPEDQPYADEDIVYSTKTGKKYHIDGCSHLSKSKIPISLDQAQQQGLTPCSVCYPAT